MNSDDIEAVIRKLDEAAMSSPRYMLVPKSAYEAFEKKYGTLPFPAYSIIEEDDDVYLIERAP